MSNGAMDASPPGEVQRDRGTSKGGAHGSSRRGVFSGNHGGRGGGKFSGGGGGGWSGARSVAGLLNVDVSNTPYSYDNSWGYGGNKQPGEQNYIMADPNADWWSASSYRPYAGMEMSYSPVQAQQMGTAYQKQYLQMMNQMQMQQEMYHQQQQQYMMALSAGSPINTQCMSPSGGMFFPQGSTMPYNPVFTSYPYNGPSGMGQENMATPVGYPPSPGQFGSKPNSSSPPGYRQGGRMVQDRVDTSFENVESMTDEDAKRCSSPLLTRIIVELLREGDGGKTRAWHFFERLCQLSKADVYQYSVMLNACVDSHSADKLIERMGKSGIKPSEVTFQKMYKIYLRDARVKDAAEALEKMNCIMEEEGNLRLPDDYTNRVLTDMLLEMVKEGDESQAKAFELFNKLKAAGKVNVIHYNVMLNTCESTKDAVAFMNEAKKAGIEPSERTCLKIAKMYIKEGEMPCTQQMLDAVIKGLRQTSLFGGPESNLSLPRSVGHELERLGLKNATAATVGGQNRNAKDVHSVKQQAPQSARVAGRVPLGAAEAPVEVEDVNSSASTVEENLRVDDGAPINGGVDRNVPTHSG